MRYEKTPIKHNAKDIIKKQERLTLEQFSTSRLLWTVVKRHKFAIVATWAIIITVVNLFPPLPDLALSIVK